MKTIYKFPIEITDEQKVRMPLSAKILCIQMQGGIPCIWAKVVSDDKCTGLTTILTFGTGNPVNDGGDYIGTYQDKSLVFHVFTKKTPIYSSEPVTDIKLSPGIQYNSETELVKKSNSNFHK